MWSLAGEAQRRYSSPMVDDGHEGQVVRREELRGIKSVASQLGVTQRTLRFYEDKGLIEPQRVGATRIYSRREVGRMQLILRGKRLGFSLKEIKEFLDLYEVDPEHIEQMRRLGGRVRERLADLEQQRIALELTVKELREIERDVGERLKGL